ncbi:DNA recombination protein RmuC [Candidatus Palibaumannia cicadellinicola]|uniref:DNA recombination protein RmuC n=1 Tax=Candidatus Palibaumannia cicadellinicola TaxID=186490 RepID=A0A0K2BKB5_9GAMM|nr:DNA recombination protein RmuC [Candidatus Baumannia cicadellinicola]AKZ65642.1 DNA recombination protein RmuC [Candidatus Baumannia cicadellinicola]
MNLIIFYSVSSALLGVLIGWLIASIIYQKQHLEHQVEWARLLQTLQITHKQQAHELSTRQQLEQKLCHSERSLQELYSKLATAEERLSFLEPFRQECSKLSQELRVQQEKNISLNTELLEVTLSLEKTKSRAEEKPYLFVNSFEKNRQSIDQIMIPLREELDSFRRQMQDSFSNEARELHSLTNEISNLHKLHINMTKETVNLTKALKGDNKIQGNWGEIVLSKVLEASGLREGHEFHTQVSLQHIDEKRLQPDVIVRLPQDKDVIIDAKMSLVAYERYFNSDNEVDRKSALIDHINSLRTHMKKLGKKDYQRLLGLRSLDYVLMFIPVEPAFIVAINKHPELISEALSHNIMLVSPTTLLVALRTITNLWRYEHQSSNAQHIADRATRLYDKFRLFVDDMNTIGQSLDKAQVSYRLAIKKLAYGRGNMISQAELFRKLGVEIQRPISQIPNSILDNHLNLTTETDDSVLSD